MFDYFYMLKTRKHIYIYMCKKVVSTVWVNSEEACFGVVVAFGLPNNKSQVLRERNGRLMLKRG